MKKYLCFLIVILLASCQNQQRNSSTDSLSSEKSDTAIDDYRMQDAIVFASDGDAPEPIAASMKVIRDNYNELTRFVDQPQFVEDTSVKNRFKVSGKFTCRHNGTDNEEYYDICIQNFDGTWEYGTLLIGSSPNLSLASASFVSKGKMNELEQTNGGDNKMLVDGIEFTIAEKNQDAIRIYTQNKLNTSQIKQVIKELKDQYSTIQLATKDKHDRGEEYASLSGDMYFNFDTNEIVSIDKFLK